MFMAAETFRETLGVESLSCLRTGESHDADGRRSTAGRELRERALLDSLFLTEREQSELIDSPISWHRICDFIFASRVELTPLTCW
jgi:hypothetical protein